MTQIIEITIGSDRAFAWEVDEDGGRRLLEDRDLGSLRIPVRIPPGHCGFDIGWLKYSTAKVRWDHRWDSGDHNITDWPRK